MEEKLKNMIRDICEIDVDQFTDEEKEYPLLSRKFNVLPYQMLVLFMKVERQFNIKIDDEKIVDGKFNTYNNILKLVTSKQRESEVERWQLQE